MNLQPVKKAIRKALAGRRLEALELIALSQGEIEHRGKPDYITYKKIRLAALELWHEDNGVCHCCGKVKH